MEADLAERCLLMRLTARSVVQALTDAGFSCWPIEISSGAEIVNE